MDTHAWVKKHGIYNIADLQKHYYSKTRGHWFDASTMKFFKSRLSSDIAYAGPLVIFFSSEQGPNQAKRRYSIRTYNTDTGAIDTIGLGFQGYATLAAAKLASKKLVDK